MRYRYLRSLLRTALAVGLVTSGHQHLQAVGLGALNLPQAGVCFIHDLNWESFSGSYWKLEDERSIDTPVATAPLADAHSTATSLDASQEQQAAKIAAEKTATANAIAAEQIKVAREQATVVLDAINAKTTLWGSQAKQCLMPLVLLPERVNSAVAFGSVRMVEWLKASDVAPITTLVSEQDAVHGINLVESESGSESGCYDADAIGSAHLSIATLDDFSDDAASDWDCSDWYSTTQNNAAVVLPPRDRANTFVFQFDNTADASLPSEPTVVELQGGMDPVCQEIQNTDDTLCWEDICDQPQMCCPMDQEMLDTAIADSQIVLAQEKNTPPTLDSDLIATAQDEPKDVPPLDAVDAIEHIAAADATGVGHCTVDSVTKVASVSTDAAQSIQQSPQQPEGAITTYRKVYRDWPMDYATQLTGDELPLGIPNWMDKSIWGRGWCDSNPMQQRTSYIGRYSREDLQYANQVSTRVFNPAQIDCHTEFNQVDALIDPTHLGDDLNAAQPSVSQATTGHASLFGSLILPFAISKCFDLGHDRNFASLQYDLNWASKRLQLAKQVRSIKQLLIEFAGTMESSSEIAEFATRDADIR